MVKMDSEIVQLSLSKDEALVLFEAVSLISEKLDLSEFLDTVEFNQFCALEAELESKLHETFSPNYKDLLGTAKKRLERL